MWQRDSWNYYISSALCISATQWRAIKTTKATKHLNRDKSNDKHRVGFTYRPSLTLSVVLSSSWSTACDRDERTFTPVKLRLRNELPYVTTYNSLVRATLCCVLLYVFFTWDVKIIPSGSNDGGRGSKTEEDLVDDVKSFDLSSQDEMYWFRTQPQRDSNFLMTYQHIIDRLLLWTVGQEDN